LYVQTQICKTQKHILLQLKLIVIPPDKDAALISNQFVSANAEFIALEGFYPDSALGRSPRAITKAGRLSPQAGDRLGLMSLYIQSYWSLFQFPDFSVTSEKPTPLSLAARDVEFSYDGNPILKKVTASIVPGQLTALVGPNGSGKSTLLSALARFLKLPGGRVELNGEDIQRKPTREVARQLAILPQSPPLPEGLTVFDLVSRGRYPHVGVLGLWGDDDLKIIQDSMALTGVLDFADRQLSGLSGGQRQRCWIAMALAQQTPILLLDEPTSALDLRYQLEILGLLKDLTRHHGRTVVVALHDLNMAAAFADQMIFFRSGAIQGAGPTHEVCTPALIENVFEVAVDLLSHPQTGQPVFVPRFAQETY